jgi:cytochrome b6-f complex iron-sulfur subunit
MSDQLRSQNSGPGQPVRRRTFIQALVGFSVVATLGGVLTPIIAYLWPPAQRSATVGERVAAGDEKDLPAGQGKVVSAGDKPVIVVHTAQGGIKAYSAVCTHLGCIVGWQQSRGFIQCPCHDGRFNPVTGAVISGPPPRPLPSVQVSIENGKIYVEVA